MNIKKGKWTFQKSFRKIHQSEDLRLRAGS